MSVNCLSLFPPTPPNSFFSQNKLIPNVGPSSSTYLPKLTCAHHVGFDDFAAVTHNKVLIAAGVSAAVGQLSKPFTGVLLYGRSFDIRAVVQAGGFPSTHSSAVVATATCLALERGFADSIVGMSVVYASLVMYDAQGVRRAVGIHAKALNRLLLEYQTRSLTGEEDTVNSVPGRSFQSSSTREEPGTSRIEESTATQLLESKKPTSSSLTAAGEESIGTPHFRLLKESIGHTEVEVIAGAFLGFLVSLIVNSIL